MAQLPLRKALHGRAMNMVLPSLLILAAMVLLIWCHATAKLGSRSIHHASGMKFLCSASSATAEEGPQ